MFCCYICFFLNWCFLCFFFFFQAEDGIRDHCVTGVQTCALPISLERFLHKAYLGQKQFSIEGLDMTVPMLDEMIQLAAAHGAREVVVGMAHRGRLNVLAHNLGRPYETIFAEFEGASTLEAVTSLPQGGTGDVKYHHGSQGSYVLPDGGTILVNLESNPSHLEYVHP